jgi:hypothetical protein
LSDLLKNEKDDKLKNIFKSFENIIFTDNNIDFEDDEVD